MLSRLIVVAALIAAPAAAQDFSPADLDGLAISAPVEVMVLGTPHLSGAPDAFRPDMLDPLLDALAAFDPTHIAVEAVSGEQARFLVSEAARYPGLADQFARTALHFSDLADEALALSPAEAAREAEARLDGPLDPAARRELAVLFARAGEPYSALVHWLALPEAARRSGGAMGQELAEALDQLAVRRNETVLVGTVLAARLGLGRVHGMDDWGAGDLFLSVVPALRRAIEADPVLSAVMDDPALAEVEQAEALMTSPGGVMEAYRRINDPDAQARRAEAEWGAFLRAPSAPEAARARLAAWQARNLRMAAHILEATRGAPGARVLVIVGASHKPYLEAALDDLGAVDIVAFAPDAP